MSGTPVMNSQSVVAEARWAGGMLMVSTVLSLGVMVYHPVMMRTKDLAGLVDEYARQAQVNAWVHGSLIVLMHVVLLAYSTLCRQLGWDRLLVRAAFLAAFLSTVAMTIAALLSGFVIPEFVASYGAAPQHAVQHQHDVPVSPETTVADQQQLSTLKQIIRLARAGNQVCSKVGVLAGALAWLGWSLVILQRATRTSTRWTGYLGTVAGLGLSVALVTGLLPMNVHGMLAYVGVHCLWSIAIGWHLWWCGDQW